MGDSSINNGYQFQNNWAVSSSAASANQPGATGVGKGKTANPEKLALAFLSRMSETGTSQYGAAQNVKGVQATQNAQAGQRARFSGQANTASMPPPAAPKVQFNAQTQNAFQSFATESKAAMASTANYASAQPGVANQVASKSLIGADSNSMDQVAGDTTTWMQNLSQGTAAYANGGLGAFMRLCVENSNKAINALQDLAGSSADLQSTLSEQQAAQADAAAKEAQKSQKKAGILGVFQKIFAVIIAVVSVVVSVLTMQPELAALAISAAATAFVAAGAAKGGGKGFDFFGGLEWFNNIAGIAGLGAIVASAAKAGMDMALVGMRQGLEEGSESAIKAATSNAGKGAGSMTDDGAQEAASAERVATGAAGGAEDAGETAAQSSTKAMEAEALGDLVRKQGNAEVQAVNASKNGDDLQVGKWSAFKTKMAANLTKMTGCNTMAEYGSQQMKVGAAYGLLQGGNEAGTAGLQLQVSLHQANSDEDMAQFTQLKSLVTMLDSTYKTANDLVQSLVKSHSNAIDEAQNILKGNNDVLGMINNNMSQI